MEYLKEPCLSLWINFDKQMFRNEAVFVCPVVVSFAVIVESRKILVSKKAEIILWIWLLSVKPGYSPPYMFGVNLLENKIINIFSRHQLVEVKGYSTSKRWREWFCDGWVTKHDSQKRKAVNLIYWIQFCWSYEIWGSPASTTPIGLPLKTTAALEKGHYHNYHHRQALLQASAESG